MIIFFIHIIPRPLTCTYPSHARVVIVRALSDVVAAKEHTNTSEHAQTCTIEAAGKSRP